MSCTDCQGLYAESEQARSTGTTRMLVIMENSSGDAGRLSPILREEELRASTLRVQVPVGRGSRLA